jgi:hypothetical protein
MFKWFRRSLDEKLESCNILQISRELSHDGNADWRYFLHPQYNQYHDRIIGKWVYHGDPKNLEEVSFRLLPVIARGWSPAMKYRTTLNNPEGPFSHLLPPLCVYSTNNCKEGLERQILALGIRNIYWQLDQTTRELHEKLKSEGITPDSY